MERAPFFPLGLVIGKASVHMQYASVARLLGNPAPAGMRRKSPDLQDTDRIGKWSQRTSIACRWTLPIWPWQSSRILEYLGQKLTLEGPVPRSRRLASEARVLRTWRLAGRPEILCHREWWKQPGTPWKASWMSASPWTPRRSDSHTRRQQMMPESTSRSSLWTSVRTSRAGWAQHRRSGRQKLLARPRECVAVWSSRSIWHFSHRSSLPKPCFLIGSLRGIRMWYFRLPCLERKNFDDT